MKLSGLVISLVAISALVGCAHAPIIDKPRLPAGVLLRDIEFHSTLLDRDMKYRVVEPTGVPTDAVLPVTWLFHGADANYQSWSNETDIAEFAQRSGVFLVMPEARNSYYIDTATDRRYQSYLVEEVIPDFRRRFTRASTERARNAVIGISRGGYGAITIAMKHPELFSYVAAMSPAVDLAERPFRWTSPLNSISYRRAYGPPGGITRRDNDPFLLIEHPHAAQQAPYFYLICGDKDELLPSTQRFAAALAQRGFASELHIAQGGHDWGFWSGHLPAVEASLSQHLHLQEQVP